MGSKGRVPPHVRRPIPGHPMMHHPEQFGLGVHPPPGPFPFDMLPPPELMEQKLAAQHSDMQRLATENQRLAATHSILRQELARAQQELQRLQSNVGAMKTENDHQMRGLLDKIAKMEVDLQAAEPVKLELQQAQADAQSLAAARQELIAKVQHLAQDLQRSHVDTQEIPAMMSELEGLKQEYQHCRATYDYEKKIYNDHLESLQVMEKNYVSMARELEKLRAELANKGSSGHQYGGATGYKEDGQHTVGQNPYEDGYGVSQGRGHQMGVNASYGGVPSAPAAALAANAHGPGYDAAGGRSNYDAARGVAGYNEVRGAASYDAPRGGPGYNAPRGGGGYDVARGGPGYSAPRGDSVYEAPRGSGYDAQLSRGAGGPQAAIPPGNTAPYGSSATPSGAVGGGYEAPPRGTSAGRR